jgi:hypothetical protein
MHGNIKETTIYSELKRKYEYRPEKPYFCGATTCFRASSEYSCEFLLNQRSSLYVVPS